MVSHTDCRFLALRSLFILVFAVLPGSCVTASGQLLARPGRPEPTVLWIRGSRMHFPVPFCRRAKSFAFLCTKLIAA